MEHWNEATRPDPVSVGVNRRVWRVEDSFLVSSWSDDRPSVHRELELTLPLADRPIVERAAAAAERVQDLLSGSQLIHGDPSFPNLLCTDSAEGPRLVGILDWQEAAIDSPLTDLSALGSTIWFRSNVERPGQLLGQALRTYEQAGGKAWPYSTVLLATLTAKLQSVAHHGGRYVAGKGPHALLAEQPRQLGQILDELATNQVLQ